MSVRNFIESLNPRTAGLLAFIYICLVHALYVFFWGVDVPYWDQWDGEAEWYKRLVDGTWDLPGLIAPHNEHRIAFTRIFNGVFFVLAGGWRPILVMYAQIPLFAFSVALLCAWLIKFVEKHRFAAIALTLFAFSLPVYWENILSGFQNAFYFMLLFALVAIYQAATAKSTLSLILALTLSLLSPFTMAGGIATIIVVWLLFFLRLLEPGGRRIRWVSLLLILSMGLALHAKMLVHVPGHDVLRAKNPKEFISAIMKIMGWPIFPVGYIAWSTVVLALFRWPRSAGGIFKALALLSGPQRLAIGLIAWYIFQAAATAYGRTHGVMSSRYQQNYALIIPIALITLEVFSCKIRAQWLRFAYAILIAGMVVRTMKDLPYMQNRVSNNRFARDAILRAVHEQSFALLKSQDKDGRLGHPNAERIWEQIHDSCLAGRHLWLRSSANK
jgi:hypothetical protein